MQTATEKTPIEKVREFLNSGGTMIAGGVYRQYKLTKKHINQITEAKGGFNIQAGKSKVFVFAYQCKFYR